MRIKEIHADNFMGFKKFSLKLDDKGLVLIQGINADDSSADSNGAGKSTIPDAITWCLWGETARGDSGDAVVNNKVGKDCVVSATLEDDVGTHYIITRFRKDTIKGNSLEIEQRLDPYGAGGISDLTKGTIALTQKEIERILGCNQEVFNAAVYFGQEQMPNLPAMTDKNLKIVVEEAAGVKLLEKAYEIAKKETLAVERKRDDRGITLASQKMAERVSEDEVDRAKAAFDAFELDRPNQKAHFTAEADRLEASRVVVLSKLPDISALETEKKECEDILGMLESEKKEEKRLNDGFVKIRQEVVEANRDIDYADRAVKSAERNLEAVSRIVGKPCGECGREYSAADLKSTAELRKADLAEAQRKFKLQKEVLEKLTGKLTESREAYDSYVATMTDVGSTVARLNEVSRKLEVAKEVKSKADSIEPVIKFNREQAEKAMTCENPHEKSLNEASMLLAKRTAERKMLEFEVEKLEEELLEAQKVAEVFSPSGVRAYILDSVTPFLNTKTAEYLSILSDGNITATWTTLVAGAKGVLKEKFCIEVENSKGAKRYNSLSGGEKRKVRLATAMALQDLVSSRATKPIRFMACDEIDDSLDAAGLERLMTILNNKAKERGTILVISHNDLASFIPNIITVEKKSGVSKIADTTSVAATSSPSA